MRSSSLLLIAISILALLIAIQPAGAVTAHKILFEGDSITIGYNLNLNYGDARAWPNVLMNRSQMAGYTMVNRGIGGQTSSQLLANLATHLAVDTPQYAVVMIGTNDVYYNVSETTTEGNYVSIVAAIQNAGATPILCTILPYSNGNATQKTEASDLNAWIRTYCYNNNILLIDADNILSNINDPNVFTSGMEDSNSPLHPSVAGYAYLANHINTKEFTVSSAASMYPYSFSPLNFQYSQDVIYTNGAGSELTNYDLFLWLQNSSSPSSGYFLNTVHSGEPYTFWDFVVTDSNGYPLYYYNEYQIPLTQAQFDFMAPDVPADNYKFRVYYGNNAYSDKSNGTGTFPLLFDQWSTKSTIDTGKWTISGSPTWNSAGYMQFTNGQGLFSNGDNFGLNTALTVKSYNYTSGYGVNTYSQMGVTGNHIGYIQHNSPNDFEVFTTTYASSGYLESYQGKSGSTTYHDIGNSISLSSGGFGIFRTDSGHTTFSYGGSTYTSTAQVSTNNMGIRIISNGAEQINASVVYVRPYYANEPAPASYSNERLTCTFYAASAPAPSPTPTPTPTPSPGVTPTPYPTGSFTLSASTSAPAQGGSSTLTTNTGTVSTANVAAITYWQSYDVDGSGSPALQFYQEYYQAGGTWYRGTPGGSHTATTSAEAFGPSITFTTAGIYKMDALLYSTITNPDGSNVYLGSTNTITINCGNVVTPTPGATVNPSMGPGGTIYGGVRVYGSDTGTYVNDCDIQVMDNKGNTVFYQTDIANGRASFFCTQNVQYTIMVDDPSGKYQARAITYVFMNQYDTATVTLYPATNTVTPGPIVTPTPQPPGTFSLAGNTTPNPDQVDQFTISGQGGSMAQVYGIAWFVDDIFTVSYYQDSSGWHYHIAGNSPSQDIPLADPLHYAVSWHNGIHTINAKVYSFATNPDGGHVWLGDTNVLSITVAGTTPQTITFTGQTADYNTGNAVAGASVSVMKDGTNTALQTTTSSASGIYTLTVTGAMYGDVYKLEATKTGYNKASYVRLVYPAYFDNEGNTMTLKIYMFPTTATTPPAISNGPAQTGTLTDAQRQGHITNSGNIFAAFAGLFAILILLAGLAAFVGRLRRG